MTSEIRANTIKNRVGLGTVSFTNTGAIVSGIVTANTFRLPDATSGSLGRVQLGNSLDLSLFHDGTNSFLVNNTGYLSIQSQDGVNGIFIARNAEVNLYYGPSVRMQTSSAGITVNRDLDVDGHTNLDNVSIAGVTTMSSHLNVSGNTNLSGELRANANIRMTNAGPKITFVDDNHNPDYEVGNYDGVFRIRDATSSVNRLTVNSTGVSITNNLDVDGHTNLDNVSIAGVTTFASDVQINGDELFIADSIKHVGDTDTLISFPSNDTINFRTGGSDRLRITSGGNVGIGTDNVSKRVQISGTAGCQFQVHPHTGGFDIGVTSGDIAPHYQTKFVLYNGQFGSGTERLRITSDGKVGFNIPTIIRENIHTHQADSSQNYLRFTNTGTGTGASDGFNIGITAAEESLVWNFETTDMLFATANTLRLKIGSDGTPAFYSPAVAWHEGPAVLEASNGYAEIFFRSTGNTHGTSTTGTWALGKLSGTDGFGILKHGMSGSGAVRVDAALSISNDGHTTIGKYLKTPKRPAFIAGRTGGNQTHTPQPFPLNATRLNVGNHYNTSTYKFVAPVAGLYYFFGQVYYNNGNGYYRVGIRKTPNGGSAIMLNTSALKVVGNDNAQQTSVIEELSVGDTVELYSDQNTAIQCYYNINNTSYGAHTYFMGYLIG